MLVLHAPHSGQDEDEGVTWWEETSGIVRRFHTAGRIVVLGDCNAKSGRVDGIHVFEKDDVSSKHTNAFRDFLTTCDLCLPTTGAWHVGESTTWTTPNGEHESRIDYTMVGCSFTGDIRHSQVLTELDLGDLVMDHRAVGLQLEWCVSGVSTSQDTKWRVNYDRTAILEKNIVRGIAADLSETQVSGLERQHRGTCDAIHPTSTRCPAEMGAEATGTCKEAVHQRWHMVTSIAKT